MLLSVTEASKAVGCARSTIYDKIKSGELSRNSGGKIDTTELLRVFGELKGHSAEPEAPAPIQNQQVDIDLIAADLLEIVREKDAELSELRNDLDDTRNRLQDHREAARLLMSPEQFSEQVEAAVNAEREKAEVSANAERQESERRSAEWKQALAERQAEIADAKREAAELSDRLQREADKVQHEADERAKAESLNRALQGRGFIARLLNRQPETV